MKKNILIFSAFYFPGELGGGPIRSILNIVNHLGNLFNFKIVTSDRDYKRKIRYQNISSDAWNPIYKSEAYYLSPRNISTLNIFKILKNTNYDLLYLNSFFDVYFSIIPLIIHKYVIKSSLPVILAPRGEFSSGALSQKKYKKLFYIWVARLLGLYKGVYFQATTSYELDDIKANIGLDESYIKVVSDLSEKIMAPEYIGNSISSNYLKICFLSRIVPIKNLEFAIKIIKLLRIPVKFDIYGPIEDEIYWDSCSSLLTKLPSNIEVKYCGAVNNQSISSVLPLYDVFFVPSKGENYGHVFVEAWSCGLPVLVSSNTPWKELADLGIGWDIPLNEVSKFTSALNEVYEWTSEKRFEVRNACIKYAQKIVNNPETVKANIDLFSKILEAKSDHQCE